MDRTEFDSWVWQVGPGLHRTGYLITGDWDVARELAVDACARTHAEWARTPVPEAHARALVAREALSLGRRSGPRGPAAPHTGLAGLLGDDPADAGDRRTSVSAALDGLPPTERAALVLQYYDGLTEEQVAGYLDLPLEVVRAATDRALDALRAWGLDDGWGT